MGIMYSTLLSHPLFHGVFISWMVFSKMIETSRTTVPWNLMSFMRSAVGDSGVVGFPLCLR
jgi:hypothetical protein